MSMIVDGRHQFGDPLGELPPPAPRICFGRDELIEKLVGFAGNREPIALLGAGGIGKTSIALSVLHDGRIKKQFGDNRRFIRCDQFHTSCAHFLSRLSKVIGAGIENPKDLVSLRPFLISRDIFIVLDNAESILDPHAIDAQKIYDMVNELCQFETICLFITSRLKTVPWCCKRPEIPMLSMEAARNIFYCIHDNGEQSGIIDNILQQLGFHALSVTLLAAAASNNSWDCDELAEKWGKQQGKILRTDYESLAATIELSLASPTFCNLGPDARDLLGVVAFFPQGVDERNLDSFFPAITDRKNIFNKFHVLSLTHRRNGFITMLAPIRDYFGPKDPNSFPVLCAVKDSYFTRLSIDLHPGDPGFEEAQWILSEDVNVEYLLDVFTSIDKNADDVWKACAHFMDHLYWHKRRQTVLAAKINDLPDDHPSKFDCLLKLSLLFRTVGNDVEQKRLLSHILGLERERGPGNDVRVAVTLEWLSETNRMLDLYEEGIEQAKEALEIYARLGDTTSQASCLVYLARLLQFDKQLDAAVNAAARAIKLLPQRGKEFLVCKSHRVLGNIYFDKGKREMAIHHFEIALGVASPFNWHDQLYWIHLSLAQIFAFEDKFSDAEAHIEEAKTHTVMGEYFLGDAMMLQASIWFRQNRLEDARSELSGALEIFRGLGM